MNPSSPEPIVDVKPTCSNDSFDMFANAFLNVAEIMRYHGVEIVSKEIGYLYGIITGNEYFVAAANTCHTSPVIKFRQEMSAFVDNRIDFLLKTAIATVKNHFGLTDEDISKSASGKIDDKVISSDVELTRHDLQHLEFSVLRICDYILQNKRLDNYNTDISVHEEYDTRKILSMLIYRYNRLSGIIARPNYGRYANARIVESNDADCGSTKCFLILGFIIARLVLCTIFSKEKDSVACTSQLNQTQQTLVGDDYAKYSNIGSLNYSSMICCFKYETLLPAGVINDAGHLSTIEKQFLLNLLVLSKLA